MSPIRFIALPSETCRALWDGARDANGQPPERRVSDGSGLPCRHCLSDIAAGEAYLVLAHRPFPAPQPYAEIGPIFLHAEPCPRYDAGPTTPASFLDREGFLVRGYGADDRIVYGTGGVVPSVALETRAAELLGRTEVAYIHVRSATNSCYQCRIERAP